MTRAVDNHLDFVLNNRDVVRIFGRYRQLLADEPRAHYQRELDRYEQLFTVILQQAMDAEVIARGDVALLRLSILGMINSTSEWFRQDGRLQLDEVKSKMTVLIVARLLGAE